MWRGGGEGARHGQYSKNGSSQARSETVERGPDSTIQRKSASHWERREFAGRRSELSAGSRFVNPGPRVGFIYIGRDRPSREAAERESPARQCGKGVGSSSPARDVILNRHQR